MESTVTAIAIIVGLSACHVRNRRRPGWPASDDGRFFIYCGYTLVAIAAYWLVRDRPRTVGLPTVADWKNDHGQGKPKKAMSSVLREQLDVLAEPAEWDAH